MPALLRIAAVLLACQLLIDSATAAERGPGQALARPLQSRSVAEILRGISHPGLSFIFSSQLVPDSLQVMTEPAVGDELATASAILAPHGLALQQVQPGLYAVVRAAPAAPPAGASTPPAGAERPAEALSEIVVSGSRYRIGDVSEGASSVNLLDATSLRDQPGLGDDPVRALQRLPGIAHNGVSAGSNVRGGDQSETLLLLDGYPLRRAFHLSGYQSLFSVIDAQLIDGAEVYTGGFPARYGNRMSGVFDLHTIRAGETPRRSLAVDFFNASARASGGRDEPSEDGDTPIGWLAAARIGTLKPLLHVFAPSTGSPTYEDGYLRGSWGDVRTLRVTGNVLVGRDELAIERRARDEHGQLESRSRYFWLRFEREWSRTLQASLWVGQTRLETRRDGESGEPLIVVGNVFDRRSARLTEVRSRIVWQLRPTQLIEGGFELSDEDARYDYVADVAFAPAVATLFGRAATDARALQLSPERRRGAVFLSHRWQITDSITSEIGGRAQRLLTRRQSVDWISEPRLGLRWQIEPDTRVQVTWGHFNQVDEINELQVEDGRTQFASPQRSEHLIVGVEHQLAPRLGLRVEAFQKRQTNPRVRYENFLDQQTILPEIEPDRVAIQPTRAQLAGLELSLTYDDRQWRTWATAGWSRSVDRLQGHWVPRAWDQPWMLASGAQWHRGGWQLGGQVELHRGWPQTSLLRDASGAVVLGARNGARLPLFLQVDLRAQYTRPVARGELAFTAEVVNAQGERQNACCTELVIRDGELAGRRLNWLPIVPSLGVRWNF